MAPQILRPREAAARLGISVATLYRRVALCSDFPKPIRLGAGNAVGYLESDIADWIGRQVEATRVGTAPAA